MLSTNTYIPYFYIIRHINSQKLYAGSKWGIDANPNNFMTFNGYTTSSTIINSLIQLDGLNSFEILRIDTNCDGLHVYEYETLFLRCNNCAKSDNWLNFHNNSGMAFGLPEFNEKSKQTSLSKYGYEFPQQSEQIKEKTKQTNLKIYGVKYTCLSDQVKQKSKKTINEKYGVDNVFQNENIKSLSRKTSLSKYGHEFPQQSEQIKEKIKQTNLELYNVSCPLQNKIVKQKTKKTLIDKFNVDNISKFQVQCPWCNTTGGYSGMMSKHFDNCKFNPNTIKKNFICTECNSQFTAKNTLSRHIGSKRCLELTRNNHH